MSGSLKVNIRVVIFMILSLASPFQSILKARLYHTVLTTAFLLNYVKSTLRHVR